MESAPNRELPGSSWQSKYGKVEITEENVESCYTSAVLKNESLCAKVCMKFICENLRVENCIRFLKFAKDTIRDEELLVTVRDFVLKSIEEVKSRPEFMQLEASTIATLLVPITNSGKGDNDEQQLDFSPSELFLSLYEWMSSNRSQRLIKFDEFLDQIPMELLDLDVLERGSSDEELQDYPRIRKKFFDALLKKCREVEQHNNRKSALEAELEEQMDSALNHLEPTKVEVDLTSAASDNEEGDVSEEEEASFSGATEPPPSVAGSTVSFEISSTPECDDLDDVIVNSYLSSTWLSEVTPKVYPYFPQVGDDLVYLRQGHKRYMQEVAKTRAYPITSDITENLPYKRDRDLPSEVSVKLTKIIFKNYPPRVAVLTLERTGWDSREPTGGSFLFHYHILRKGTDFLVLREVYDSALKRQWKTGDKFTSLRTGRTGSIQGNYPFQSSSFPNSHYLSFLVAWEDQSEELLSPWELGPVESEPEVPLRESGVQAKKSKRISSLLDLVLKSIPTGSRFLSPHPPESDDHIDYPVSLTIIKARLDNLFYQSSEAILTDSDHLALNAAKSCFPPDGLSAAPAKALSQLIREIVSDVHMTQESLEKRLTELFHPGPGYGNTSGGRSEGRGNENPSTSVENSMAVAVGGVRSTKPFNIDSRRGVVTRTTVQLSLVQDFDKTMITSNSLSSRSRISRLQGAEKKVSKKEEELQKKVAISPKPKKYYECTYCDYQNPIQSVVKDHENKHTGEKPHSCPDCHLTFAYRRSLYKHQAMSCKARKIPPGDAQ